MRLIYNLDYGLNLEKYVNADVTREMLQAVQNDVRNELIKDERLTDVTVIVEWIPESSTVKIKTKCFTNEGSFTNIVIVNSLGVSFEAA
jgi:SAM-dependent MidA family methyltransferase